MNGRGRRDQNSTRSYRWVRLWLWAGVVFALLLLGNSVRDYFFVSHFIAQQQVRHQLSQRVAAFEHDLRTHWTPGTPRLQLLSDEMASASLTPLWIILRGPGGEVLEQKGTPPRVVFTHEEEGSHFQAREPLFTTLATSQGEAVAEVFPVYAAPRAPQQPQPGGGPPFLISVEVAIPLAAADPASLWPIRRNLIINLTSGFALLVTVALSAWGFRAYVRGRSLEQQVEIARQVQANLLPSNTQTAGGVHVAVEYQPAEEVGGDFYDTFPTQHGLALVIGDVSGKGIPAALLMGVIHGAVRSSAWAASRQSHEHETAELNRLLCERTSGERFTSLFWSYCDESRSVHYVNAGHCAPILIGLRNRQAEIRRLDIGGPVLGLLADAAYTQGSAAIESGDVMVLFSDGLVEAANAAGEEFGEARLLEVLTQSFTGSAEQIRDAILASVREFLGSIAPQDDLTVVVTKHGES